MRLTARLAALVVIFSLARAAASPNGARGSYEQALALYQEGRFDEAAAQFLAAYSVSGKAVLLFNAAQAYRKAGRRDETQAMLRWFLDEAHGDPADVVREADTLLHQLTTPPRRAAPPPPPAKADPCGDEDCAPAPAAPPPTVYLPAPPSGGDPPGWALSAGVSGIVMSALTLAIGMSAEATRAHQIPALPLGVVTTLIFAIDTPISAAGATSTRVGAGVPGVPGLRVSGWIGYGLGLAGAVVLLGMGAAQLQPPPGVIAATTVVATGGNLFLSIDGVVSWQQARERRGRRVSWIAPTAFAF